jgi:rhodanese-related sulfurtransferase
MKLRQIFVALALLVACSVGARAQEAGEGQNLPRITLDEFKQLLARNAITVLDVRNGDIAAKIKGAAHIAETDLQSRLKDLPHDREIVTYCA